MVVFSSYKGKKTVAVQTDGVENNDRTTSSLNFSTIQKSTILPESATLNAAVCRQRIIVCMDGTWDSASVVIIRLFTFFLILARTNVFRFYNSLKTSYPLSQSTRQEQEQEEKFSSSYDKTVCWSQVTHYVKGVGTRNERIQKYLGGAFGLGISDQILTAYAFLSENYKGEQDEIWLLGASRGGYAARSLTGMIYNVGLLPCEHITVALDEAYSLYRRADKKSHPNNPEAIAFRHRYNCWEPDIKFMGCFDTVGSLGVPRLPWFAGGSLLWNLFHGLHSFHDEKLSPKVKSAFHALSIHEQREWFRPTIMKYGSLKRSDQILEQLWFPGTHSDVIGGPKASRVLCNHSLRWMMIKAQECGLEFRLPIDEICGARAFLYNDSYKNQLVYRLLPRTDRYIDLTLFRNRNALYMNGHFSEYITKEQLRLFRSKALDQFLSNIKEQEKGNDSNGSSSTSSRNNSS